MNVVTVVPFCLDVATGPPEKLETTAKMNVATVVPLNLAFAAAPHPEKHISEIFPGPGILILRLRETGIN